MIEIAVELRILAVLERIATALEQSVLEHVAEDPYPANLTPADEIADLPPVIPQDLCPIHKVPWKTVPAGVSKKTGQPYTSFRACSVSGCDQRPPR